MGTQTRISHRILYTATKEMYLFNQNDWNDNNAICYHTRCKFSNTQSVIWICELCRNNTDTLSSGQYCDNNDVELKLQSYRGGMILVFLCWLLLGREETNLSIWSHSLEAWGLSISALNLVKSVKYSAGQIRAIICTVWNISGTISFVISGTEWTTIVVIRVKQIRKWEAPTETQASIKWNVYTRKTVYCKAPHWFHQKLESYILALLIWWII